MSRRRALRIPLAYLALITIVGLAVTALLLRYDVQEDVDQADLVTSETSQSLTNAIYEAVTSYYTPTVAGEGFVDATVRQATALNVPETALLDRGFPAFAAPLVSELGSGLLDYQLAPVGVVTYSARPAENAEAIGHNLLADDERREAILATIESRQPIVTGPLQLKQGGTGVIIRQAIFVPGLAPFSDRYREAAGQEPDPAWAGRIPDDFWGFSTTVINAPQMLAALDGLDTPADTYALRATNPDGSLGDAFVGTWDGDLADAQVRTITLPDGSTWQLLVARTMPSPLHHWPVVLLGLLGTLAAAILAVWTYRASARNRLGSRFSHAVIDLDSREAVLTATADFLHAQYPRLSGRIDGSVQDRLTVPIPVTAHIDSEDTSGGRTWDVVRGGQTQARITANSASTRYALDLDDVIAIISPLLAATLGSLQRFEAVARDSVIDHLTEVFNRRQFQPTFDELSVSVQRHGTWLGVAVVDLDDFKALNDTLGHQFGDEALRRLGRALSDSIRGTDSVYRFGGDEFVLLVTVESEEDALRLLHRVHSRANAVLTDFVPGGGSCTVSIGLCCLRGDRLEPMNEMLAKADQALYRAKTTGRDRLEVWDAAMSTTGPTTWAPPDDPDMPRS